MRATIGLTSIIATSVLVACSTGDDTTMTSFGVTNVTAGQTATVPMTMTSPLTTTDPDTDPTGGGDGTGESGETGGDPGGDPSGPAETGHGEVTGQDVTGEPGTTGPVIPPEPACDDMTLNQDETDIDCGGATCPKCGLDETCQADADCETDSCIMGVCTEPSCSDGVKNGGESGVDCGGGCMPCGDNEGCVDDADCVSEVCANEVCSPPSCGDGVQNGMETAVDCGGGCMGCGESQPCGADDDCLSGYCNNGACAPKECDDNAGCAQFNSACTQGVCNAQKKCEAQNSNEGGGCDDGNPCMTGEKCAAGVCGGAVAKDCSGMSSLCALGVCDMANGNCKAQAANEGNPCNDNNACSVAEVCTGGTCKDPVNPNGYVFYETFVNNSAGWQMDTEWGIASAKASAGHNQGNPDPATDHTPTGDNGIAGVVIGGNASTGLHNYYYLTSPAMDTTKIPGAVFLSYWRWLNSDYNPWMDNHIDVWNGNAWTTVLSGPLNSVITDNAWFQESVEVTAYKNAGFKFRVGHKVGAADAYVMSGWNLDDIVVGPAVCSP